MALSSPALTVANEVLFGNIKPVVDAIAKLGATDFTADKPEVAVKPGATVKVPWSSISAANAFDASNNNYLTGGDTSWISCYAAHYLQGFDISGVNLDQGVDANKMKNLFVKRASAGIALAIQHAVKEGLDACTESTAVTIPAAAGIEDYEKLGADIGWLDRASSKLALNGSESGKLKAAFAAKGIVGTLDELAGFCGFGGAVFIPDMNARCAIVPNGAMGFIGRVPSIIANYKESGIETDAETGLSVGIVIADDQALNRIVANADVWFGCVYQSASANASTTKGVIKVGTAT